ncbi:Internalin-A precursor [uncultured Ruminococcus sp.]|nr:Internalin-A precursor [uncultured Ruminococcus sp.]
MTYTGHTFKGWYDNENLTGSPVTAIGNTETGNKEYWAKWEINQYTVTVKPENGKADITITQDYGTAITAPADPTREGYQFNGWDKAFPTTMPAENLTITAKWKVNSYTITFDTTGGSEIAPITQDYGTAIVAPADPTREGYTFIGWDMEIPTTMPAENITLKARWKDSEKPTGEIKISENSWKAFLNNITFGLFFKDTQTVTINAADNSGESVTVEYLLSNKELTKTELDGMTFTAYTAPFGIDPDNEYIIYVRLTDKAGNTDYICSDGIVLDGTSPVIKGIENGKTYCEAQTVTIDEKYIDTVIVNETKVTLDENNSFVLSPADDEQKIIVTDKAGNTAEMTVTVNDGHTFGEWASNGDGTHTRTCTVDGCSAGTQTENCIDANKDHKCDICDYIISECADDNKDHKCDYCGKKLTEHTGGKATCAEKAVCEVCGKAYGEFDANIHSDLKHIDAKAATKDAEGNIEYWYCEGCGKYFSDKDGTKEIKKADTVTAKLKDDSKLPQTGDISNLALWIALLFVSGGAAIGTTIVSRKKKYNK